MSEKHQMMQAWFVPMHAPPDHGSLLGYVGGLGYPRPCFRFRLEERSVFLRSVAGHLVAECFHLLAGFRIGKRLREHAVDTLDERLGRAGRRQDAVPVVA